MTIRTADKNLIKKINSLATLKMIREHGPISRADIAKMTGLNPATVSSNVNVLIKNGIVIETGSGESSGGRKPILLKLNASAFYVIGVDMGIHKVTTAVINLDGEIVKKTVQYFDYDSTKEDILGKIKDSIYQVINELELGIDSFIGIGIGMHGLVDSKKGISIYAPAYNWRNINIKAIMEKEFKIPVFIENDARAMALGEKWFGQAKDEDNFVLVNVGSGIGSGIIINGELYRGFTSGAGEIGHISIVDNGPRCNCGNYGCLEAVASGPALAKRVVSKIKMGVSTIIPSIVDEDLSKITGQTIYQAACMGDKVAIDALEETGRFLGVGISNIINILNPKLILIGGGVAVAWDFIFEPLLDVVKNKSMKDAGENVRILPASLKENCGVIGAGALLLKDFFDGPDIQ